MLCLENDLNRDMAIALPTKKEEYQRGTAATRPGQRIANAPCPENERDGSKNKKSSDLADGQREGNGTVGFT